MPLRDPLQDSRSVLFVDDEPQARKWFARTFGGEFSVVTAGGADEALSMLRERGADFGVVVTDFRMPGRNGLELLRVLQREFRHLVRLLATAFAEKDVAIAAVNEGRVMRILEKPLDEELTAQALREALELYRSQAIERALNEGRVAATRETLGFLAHELNTPLATVRGYVRAVATRYRPPAPDAPAGLVQFHEGHPGELMAALEGAERRALYCQSLVSTFVQSARDAYPGTPVQAISAAALVQALVDEFPFDDDEASWVTSRITEDFMLPGRRDLLYLVLCTLTKNALLALRDRPEPRLHIALGTEHRAAGSLKHWMRFTDNGPGIAPEVLARLTREPVTTRADAGGNGMGLMFCHRVMQSIGGTIEITSQLGQGATMTLYFRPINDATHAEARA
jgi:two-component system response regulator PhcR